MFCQFDLIVALSSIASENPFLRDEQKDSNIYTHLTKKYFRITQNTIKTIDIFNFHLKGTPNFIV